MTTWSLEALTADLTRDAFAGAYSGSSGLRRIGVEVEFIPVEALSGQRCAIEGEGVAPTLPLLRRFGAKQAWQEATTAKGTPCFSIPAGGTITYEPGGQLEYSSPPCSGPSSLLTVLRSVVLPLSAAAAGEGIDLLARGIDPFNPIERAPLLLRARRYELMAEYFAAIGPAGARMMRQTASLQINLDYGDEPWVAWRVLNAMAPYVTAIFANSPIYNRRPTGFQSTRAVVWRTVDPERTGIVFDRKKPVQAYRDFALAAPAMLLPAAGGRYRRFAEWLRMATLSRHDWDEHLSTLFPEVRPRGHLELRSADVVPTQWLAAPLALVAGILYQPEALHAADALLGSPQPELLDRAAARGMHDPALQSTSLDLVDIALVGCKELGSGYFHPADLEQAEAFFDQYTSRGRSPADDVLEDSVAA